MKNVIHACVCEEAIRYCCEAISGNVSDKLMTTDKLLDECGVIAFCDRDPDSWGKLLYGKKVLSPAQLAEYDFDKVYIASLAYIDSIYKMLTEEVGIPEDKIIKSHIDFMRCARERFVYNMASVMEKTGKIYDVAEGGVFTGNFSKVINSAFPNSTLYLFDTFSGFDKRDLASDKKYLDSVNERKKRFDLLADTSLELVLSKLPHQEKAIIKKGFFPKTAEGVDGEFFFVNLDFDLYAPTKAGLEFFYPKLIRGGAILVHDYFNSNFDARKAVDEFCEENNLYPMPIGDVLSVAIIKQ